MATINRKLAGMILLAALDFKEGDRKSAAQRLAAAAEDPDFDETLEGLNEVTDEATDPFMSETAGDEDGDNDGEELDGDGSEDDATGDLEGMDELLGSSGVGRAAKRAKAMAGDDDKIGGNEGIPQADPDNGSDEDIRQTQTARMKVVRANLKALASA